MTTKPNLTESLIASRATERSFERGKSYYKYGYVISVVRRGSWIYGQVEGSEYEPYQVEILLDEGGLQYVLCSCPYDWGGDCKHIIAVLLTCLHTPSKVEEKQTADALLGDQSQKFLADMWRELLEEKPELIDWLDAKIQASQAKKKKQTKRKKVSKKRASAKKSRRTLLDGKVFRHQASAIIHSLDRVRPSQAYHMIGGVLDELRGILEQAQQSLLADDGPNALIILEALIDEWNNAWFLLDPSSGDTGAFWEEFEEPLTEALLSTELSGKEKKRWTKQVIRWRDEAERYGVYVFEMPLTALDQGWSYAPLQRAMRGDFDERGAWEDESPDYADELAQARLRILERRGQFEEYLHLAEAEGQLPHYVIMLVKLERYEEAEKEAYSVLTDPQGTLEVARSFRDARQFHTVLELVTWGLEEFSSTSGYSMSKLATWSYEFAITRSEPELALKALREAFRCLPSLQSFREIQSLVGDNWSGVREELLAELRESYSREAKVEIYLAEQMYKEAVAVTRQNEHMYSLIERVVDGVWEHQSIWALRACKEQAEPIMDEGRSKAYHHAARWLKKACKPAKAANRLAKYEEYLQGLLTKHSRKYNLVPLLEEVLQEVQKEQGQATVKKAKKKAVRKVAATQDEWDICVSQLSPRHQRFLELLEEQGTLSMQEVMEAFDLSSAKAVGGFIGSIRRWIPAHVALPYTAEKDEYGKRNWFWVGLSDEL